MKKYFLLTVFILFSAFQLMAQKKVKGKPENLAQPKDFFDNPGEVQQNLYNNTSNKSGDDAWIVISDRDANPVYKEANNSSEIVQELAFREWFYVVDEKDDWIEIAKASAVNKLKSKTITPVGWVPKDKMLLWNAGLVDKKTRIHKKAFLLNRAEDIANAIKRKQVDEDLKVNFYKHPTGQEQFKEKDRTIYDYYFVFKKEDSMMLLGQDAELSAFSIGTKLLGWVSTKRIQEWNTRISLEPNYDEMAYLERKNNKSYQFRAFGAEKSVNDFVANGTTNDVFWDSDPIKFKPSEMAKSNPYRFKGNVVRFPMFKKLDYGGSDMFRSGVIGSVMVGNNDATGKLKIDSKIQEQKFAELKDLVRDLEEKTNNVNVFFVIEGTNKTYAFQQDIAEAMRSLKSNKKLQEAVNVNYGALIYRDLPEGNRITEYERLTPDVDKVTNFISQADFSNKIDQDDFTAMYYGVKQGLKVAGFSNQGNETNIIVLIGACGDFSVDSARKSSASGEEALIKDKAVIFQNLADIGAHFHSIQLHNDGRRYTGTAYAIQSKRLMLEAAKYIYNQNANNSGTNAALKKNDDLIFVEPTMDMPVNVTSVNMAGSKPGKIILPMKKESLSKNKFIDGLAEMIDESVNYEQTIKQIFADMFNRGNSLDVREFSEEAGIAVGDLSGGIVPHLTKLMDEVGEDIVVDAMGVKISLYTEVFLPLKAQGAGYPMYSYVLFMPESDLLNYQNLIEHNISDASFGSYPEKRKSLFEIYMALIEQFAGEDLKKKKLEDLTRDDVFQIMQGIQGEGLELDPALNVRIGGIRKEKEVSNEEIDALIERFNNVSTELERIIKLNNRFDFCLISDNENRYYWLRLDQVF